jgi:tetratricopeptide (TPR) repeat protein
MSRHKLRIANYEPRITNYASRLLWIVLVFVFITSCTPVTISGEPMAQANHLYEAGEFAQAAAAYQTLVDSGVVDGVLYYNLGNAYFKSGDLGRAILNYRRAQRLLPRDADIAANLTLARAQTKDQLGTEESGLAQFVTHVLVGWTTLDEAAALALGLWIVLCGLFIAKMVLRRWHGVLFRIVTLVVAVALALCVLSVGLRIADAHGRPPGVIVADTVEVHSGPGNDYLTEFSLHAGAEIRVIEARAGWVRIALPGDLQGWVSEEALAQL